MSWWMLVLSPFALAAPESLFADLMVVNECAALPLERAVVDREGPSLGAVSEALRGLGAEVESRPTLLTLLGEPTSMKVAGEAAQLEYELSVRQDGDLSLLDMTVRRTDARGRERSDQFVVPVRSGDVLALPLVQTAPCTGRSVLLVRTLWQDLDLEAIVAERDAIDVGSRRKARRYLDRWRTTRFLVQ